MTTASCSPIGNFARRAKASLAARVSGIEHRLRSKCSRLTRDALYRAAAHLLRSPTVQQRTAMDLVRQGLVPEGESFEFMCHVLAWHQQAKSQLWQDVWVLYRSGFRHDGFFVDVGASDGVRWSNTYLLERSFGWTGILIEPHPLHHAALPANRRSKVHYGCVGPITGEPVEFWAVADYEFSGIARYANHGIHAAARDEHTTHPMVTISLNDVLRECDAPEVIDYVSLDTEGSELAILSTFDFDRYRVSRWTIEHNTINEAKIDDLMRSRGYRRDLSEWSWFDGWYVK